MTSSSHLLNNNYYFFLGDINVRFFFKLTKAYLFPTSMVDVACLCTSLSSSTGSVPVNILLLNLINSIILLSIVLKCML